MGAPVPLFSPEAEFPDGAPRWGMCLISLIVDANGQPQNPRMVRCTDSVFAANSLKAVMRYKFKPAQTQDGRAVPVMVTIEVHFRPRSGPGLGDDPPTKIRYVFFSPPGMNSTEADAKGVYPLSKKLDAPQMVEFANEGFGRAAYPFPDGVGCRAVLTIDEKGKASDAQITDCDKPGLEKPALESVLRSKYRPATLNGKVVPVRTAIHLVYDGFGTPKELKGVN